ncbi:unnamed protein product, partial [Polarella glacialis]
FANTTETTDSNQIEYIDVRGQRHPANYSPPDILGPALYNKTEAPDDWEWIFAGDAAEFPRNGGLAVKHGSQELAVFYLPAQSSSDQWMATQNICPHKQSRTISRGLTGELASGMLTLADPVYKTTYDLRSGAGIGNPNFNLSTFQTKVEDGRVLVKVPPKEQMEEAFEMQISQAYSAAGKEYKKRGHGAAAKAAASVAAAPKTDMQDW